MVPFFILFLFFSLIQVVRWFLWGFGCGAAGDGVVTSGGPSWVVASIGICGGGPGWCWVVPSVGICGGGPGWCWVVPSVGIGGGGPFCCRKRQFW
jgi:hypothetical protein